MGEFDGRIFVEMFEVEDEVVMLVLDEYGMVEKLKKLKRGSGGGFYKDDE